MNPPEQDPTARAVGGDPEARHELLERHMGSLRSYIRLRLGRRLRHKETSQDLTQSVCRQVLENFDKFNYRGEQSFRHWLLRQAENKIRDRRRFWHRDKRDQDREDGSLATFESSGARKPSPPALQDLATPSRHLSGREELERLEQIFSSMPEEFRTVIHLARIEGLSHLEIAEEMGKTVAATRTLLCRALARLATEMEPEVEPPAQ
jgi:RNA polymerase sigma-70 factor (ECF subfamily)